MTKDWKETLRERIAANLPAGLSEQMRADVLDVEHAKAVACSEAFVGFDAITDDSKLWAVIKIPNLSPEKRARMLAEVAAALVKTFVSQQTPLQKLRRMAHKYTFERDYGVRLTDAEDE